MEVNENTIEIPGNGLLIQPIQRPEETSSGFVMPEEGYTATPVQGTVLVAGAESKYKVGDVIFFRRYSIDELKFVNDEGKNQMVCYITDDEVCFRLKNHA